MVSEPGSLHVIRLFYCEKVAYFFRAKSTPTMIYLLSHCEKKKGREIERVNEKKRRGIRENVTNFAESIPESGNGLSFDGWKTSTLRSLPRIINNSRFLWLVVHLHFTPAPEIPNGWNSNWRRTRMARSAPGRKKMLWNNTEIRKAPIEDEKFARRATDWELGWRRAFLVQIWRSREAHYE